MGIGYLIAANSSNDQARSYHMRIAAAPVQPACGAPTGTLQQDCQAMHEAFSDSKRDHVLLTVGFVGAGVGVAALVATMLSWKPSREGPQVRIEAGPNGASTMLTWRYQ